MMVGSHVALFCFDGGKWDILYDLSREKDLNEQDDQTVKLCDQRSPVM